MSVQYALYREVRAVKSTILLTIALFMISAPNPDPAPNAGNDRLGATFALAPISSAVADAPAASPVDAAPVVEAAEPEAPRSFGEEWEFVQPEPVQPAALSVAHASDRPVRPAREQPWSRSNASLN